MISRSAWLSLILGIAGIALLLGGSGTPGAVNNVQAADGDFTITSITANCDGTGTVSYTGTIPQGGFTLELMEKFLNEAGAFHSTTPPTTITITTGASPVAYNMPLTNWVGPHYRVDSVSPGVNPEKSPSLNCSTTTTTTSSSTTTSTSGTTTTSTTSTTSTSTTTSSTTTTTSPTSSTTTTTTSPTTSTTTTAPPTSTTTTTTTVTDPGTTTTTTTTATTTVTDPGPTTTTTATTTVTDPGTTTTTTVPTTTTATATTTVTNNVPVTVVVSNPVQTVTVAAPQAQVLGTQQVAAPPPVAPVAEVAGVQQVLPAALPRSGSGGYLQSTPRFGLALMGLSMALGFFSVLQLKRRS